MSDGTAYLLQELSEARAEIKRLRDQRAFQKRRADLWRERCLKHRSWVSLVCGCGRTVRGRVRKVPA